MYTCMNIRVYPYNERYMVQLSTRYIRTFIYIYIRVYIHIYLIVGTFDFLIVLVVATKSVPCWNLFARELKKKEARRIMRNIRDDA